MARCTAPIHGHRTASAAAACPACSSRSRYGSYQSYSSPSYTSSSSSSGGRSNGSSKARWSPAGSTILYTPAEIRTLTPVRENIEKRTPDGADLQSVT